MSNLNAKLRQQLFDHMEDEHGLIVSEAQIDSIFKICKNKLHPTVHIMKRGSKWAIKLRGNTKATKLFSSAETASYHASDKYKNTTIIVHRNDGSINMVINN